MRKPTKKQKGFVKDYLETGNGVRAALKNYDTTDYGTANSIAVENLQKPIIQTLLDTHAEKALLNIINLGENAESEQVRLGANKDVLDRAGYQAVQKTENKNLNINFDGELTQEEIEKIDAIALNDK